MHCNTVHIHHSEVQEFHRFFLLWLLLIHFVMEGNPVQDKQSLSQQRKFRFAVLSYDCVLWLWHCFVSFRWIYDSSMFCIFIHSPYSNDLKWVEGMRDESNQKFKMELLSLYFKFYGCASYSSSGSEAVWNSCCANNESETVGSAEFLFWL